MADKYSLIDAQEKLVKGRNYLVDRYASQFPGPPPETPEEEAKRLGPGGMAHRQWILDGLPIRKYQK